MRSGHVTLNRMNLPADEVGRREFGEDLKSRPVFESLVRLVETLLGEGGCPWDQSRLLVDCPKYLKGELDEVTSAIEQADDSNLEEELGDLLFMVVFTMKLAERDGKLEVARVFSRILSKMVYRHPHVFGGDMEARTPEDVLRNWKDLKAKEKGSLGKPVEE